MKKKLINNGDLGGLVRGILNEMITQLVDGADGVNNLRKGLTISSDRIDALEEEVSSLFQNAYGGMGIATTATNPTLLPNFQGAALTYIASGAGVYTYFPLTTTGKPLSITRSDSLVILYKAEGKTTWDYREIVIDLTDYIQERQLPMLNIDAIKPLSPTVFYTKETARAAVPTTHRKKGLVITYAIHPEDETEWYAEQYKSDNISAWSVEDNWEPFGSGSGGAGGLVPLEYLGTPAATREQVKMRERRKGYMTYYTVEDTEIVEVYIADVFVDESWTGDSSWLRLVNVTDLNDLSESLYEAIAKLFKQVDFIVQDLRTDVVNMGKQVSEVSTAMTQLQESVYSEIDGMGGRINNLAQEVSKKVDGGYVEEDALCLTSKGMLVGDPIPLPTGGGGGGGGQSNLSVQLIGNNVIVSGGDSPVFLRWSFTSTDKETGEDTGPGTADIYNNNIRVATIKINQGTTSFDVTKYLSLGTNDIRIRVLDSYGSTRSIYCSVQIVQLRLESTFDAYQIFTDKVNFYFTPYGEYNKVITIYLDGAEVYTTTTTNTNRRISYIFEGLTHGTHDIRVTMYANIGEETLYSNELFYQIAKIDGASKVPVISSSFNSTEAIQFSTVDIPYIVYDPNISNATVSLIVNGVVVSIQTVPRIKQNWRVRMETMGIVTLKIQCGTVSREFTLNVVELDIPLEPETEGLELFLTSQGRSNNEGGRAIWEYEGIRAQFQNFNWSTDGWLQLDNGYTVMRVPKYGRVTIPFRIFATDFRQTGKTIEIELMASEVEEYFGELVSCMSGGRGMFINAQTGKISSEQSTVDMQFKEDEFVRLSFVIEETTQNRLIHLYINGIVSGLVQYPATDNFTQLSPVGITLGGVGANLSVATIRVYNHALNKYQILNNYIVDIQDVDEKIRVFTNNQIFDSFGDIVYSSVANRIPCMTIIGELPPVKGNKRTVKVTYDNLQEPAKSFFADGVILDIQGTSSQYYPRKNYTTKFSEGITYANTGLKASGYKLRDTSIEVATFCEKADYMESSGTHNTGMAKLVDHALRTMGYLTPPQKSNPYVRTSIDGYPICIFHKLTDDAPATFLGKYNFNNDKSTQEAFGFTGDAECWEFRNNTSDRVLFLSDDFSTDDWKNDFEGRYPDKFQNTPGSEKNLKDVVSWVVSTKNDLDKFKREFDDHFNRNNILSYYLITELFGMVDQHAKNMFLTSWGPEKPGGNWMWYLIFYDNDTCLGLNNEGVNKFLYNVERTDTLGSESVWNAARSLLWNNVEKAFKSELETMYGDLRSKGALTYTKALEILEDDQAGKWSESLCNVDAEFKYISPAVQDGEIYLYCAQGSRSAHRRWWLWNRFNYMDSKYTAADYKSDYISMRLYTPAGALAVEPNADFILESFADQYLRVKFGSYDVFVRGDKNTPYLLKAPDIQFNDTETIIYGASRLKGVGDLAPKYPGTVDVSKAVKITELLIGSGVVGYMNHNLTHVVVGNNQMLTVLDVRNCPNLSEPIDISRCVNIEEVYASGTSLTALSLPDGGVLRTLILPETLTNLTILNQEKLMSDGFTLPSYKDISTIRIENTNGINPWSIAKTTINQSGSVLERVRLIGIDVQETSLDPLKQFALIGGIDAQGFNTDVAVITGKYHVPVASQGALDSLKEIFPELTITASTISGDMYFADPEVERVCVANWDTDGSGTISYDEINSLTSLGGAFKGNNKIVTFEEFSRFIAMRKLDGDFEGCSKLQKIAFPAVLSQILSKTFKGSGLKSFTLAGSILNGGVTTVSEVFAECIELERVHFTAPIGYNSLNALFKGCTSLVEVTGHAYNSSATGRSDFEGCTSLIKVPDIHYIESVTYIANRMFFGCTSLPTEIHFKESIRTIHPEAFMDTPVRYVYISYKGSFTNANSFEEGTKVYIPIEAIEATYNNSSGESGWKYIVGYSEYEEGVTLPYPADDENFSGKWYSDRDLLNPLSSMVTPKKGTYYYRQEKMSQDPIIFADPEVKRVLVAKFDKDGDGETTPYEARLVSSMSSVFLNNRNIQTYNERKEFTKVIQAVASQEFDGCTTLKEVTFSKECSTVHSLSLKTQGVKDCNNLRHLRCEEDTSLWANGDGYLLYRQYLGTNNERTILLWVSTFLEGVFRVPDEVTYLPDTVFMKCSLLTNIEFDLTRPLKVDDSTAETSSSGAHFSGCSEIEEITLPVLLGHNGAPLVNLPAYMFNGCSKLRRVNFSNTVKAYKKYTFRNSGIEEFTIDPEVTVIPVGMFYQCPNLRVVNFNDKLLSVLGGAFRDCTSLKTLIFPDSLESWEMDAFYGAGIEEMNVPPKIKPPSYPINQMSYVLSYIPYLRKITVHPDSEYYKSEDSNTSVYSKDGKIFYGIAKGVSRSSYTILEGTERSVEHYLHTVRLGELVYPSTISRIDNDVIAKVVVCKSLTPPTIGAISGSFIESVYVPDESVETYKTATGWLASAGKIKPLSEKP